MKSSKRSDSVQTIQWEKGWGEHEQLQLQRLAALSFSEKLTWLEEAHWIVMRLTGASQRLAESSRRSAPDME